MTHRQTLVFLITLKSQEMIFKNLFEFKIGLNLVDEEETTLQFSLMAESFFNHYTFLNSYYVDK